MLVATSDAIVAEDNNTSITGWLSAVTPETVITASNAEFSESTADHKLEANVDEV